ncbi:ADP-ribosylation factor-like protein 16 isoform X2 [Loxodonta africana]|uniref:ADP-ribosylation factor-like protein 16 isoform X2 n=1 Tax=Loxodonta africana TaxID=9785 RepID=UPI000C8122CF|nr:ADP-ribosylation factor-like protein 16 isoform X2 [Loxodonta africana]
MSARRGRALRCHGAELRVPAGEGGVGMCLLLGAAGVGKTLLVKRLQKLSAHDGKGDLGDPPPTRPTVGTNLTNIVVQKITIRELGGCMSPIWPSYYGNCHALLRPALLRECGGVEVINEAPRYHRLCQTEHHHSGNQCTQRHWLGRGSALAPGHPQSQLLMARWGDLTGSLCGGAEGDATRAPRLVLVGAE